MERDYVAEYQNSKQEPLIKGHANDCFCKGVLPSKLEFSFINKNINQTELEI